MLKELIVLRCNHSAAQVVRDGAIVNPLLLPFDREPLVADELERLGSLQAGGCGIYPNHDCNSADRQTLGDPKRDGQPKHPYAQAVGEAGVPRSFKASGRHGIALGVRPWCLAWGLQGRAHGLILKEVKLCHDR